MSPQAALSSRTFGLYVALVIAVAIASLVSLLAFQWAGRDTTHAWRSFRAWLMMAPVALVAIFLGRMAVIGIACELPGASSRDELWANLEGGVDLFSPPDHVALGWIDDDELVRDDERIGARRLGELRERELDTIRYKIFPSAVSQIAPTQLLGLELTDRLYPEVGPGTAAPPPPDQVITEGPARPVRARISARRSAISISGASATCGSCPCLAGSGS